MAGVDRLPRRNKGVLRGHELRDWPVLEIVEANAQLLIAEHVPVLIQTSELTVRYGRRTTALDRVSLRLDGGVVGLLGPNGAGKTTLLSVLATVVGMTSGSAAIGDHDLRSMTGRRAARRLVGWLPQRFDLAGGMTVLDTVRYAAWANGVDEKDCESAAYRALSVVDLEDRAKDRVRRISGGQRQRLGLAAALAHEPKVLLLDEPTVGLDPAQRVRFRNFMHTAGRGRTVLLATHLLDDVEHACKQLVVLSHGRVAFDGLTMTLAEQGGANVSPLESPLERGYRHALEGESPDPEP